MEIRAILLLAVPLILAGAAAVPPSAPSTAPASAPATSASTAPARSVWAGVYTTEQMDRGKKAYNTSCARCHGDTFLGNDDAPALVGKDFLEKWNDKPVGKLVDLTQKTMPSDGPGKISRKICTDIAAYLLNANGFPAGKTELPSEAEALNTLLIQAKK